MPEDGKPSPESLIQALPCCIAEIGNHQEWTGPELGLCSCGRAPTGPGTHERMPSPVTISHNSCPCPLELTFSANVTLTSLVFRFQWPKSDYSGDDVVNN